MSEAKLAPPDCSDQPLFAARRMCLEGALRRGDAWRCLNCSAIEGRHNQRCSECGEGRGTEALPHLP